MKKSLLLSEIKKITAGNKKHTEELLAIFVRQTNEQIHNIDYCLHMRDYEGIKQAAHSLRSTFIYFTIPEIIALTIQAEKITEKTFDTHISTIKKLKQKCSELLETLC